MDLGSNPDFTLWLCDLGQEDNITTNWAGLLCSETISVKCDLW